MKVGYLMNSYPMVSTTFIGREIAALEAEGIAIPRFAFRRWDGPLVDEGDRAEAARTDYLLEDGAARLGLGLVAEGVCNPGGLWRALGQCRRLWSNAGGGLVRHAAYLLEAVALRRRLRRAPVDHIHAHFSTNAAAVAMMCRAMGGPPYSFTTHGPDELFEPIHNSLGLKVANAAFVACISHYCRSQVMIFSDPGDWDRLGIVHCGVDPARYDHALPGPAGDTGRASAMHLVYVGRLTPLKGGRLLIAAMAALRDSHPGLRLTVIGDGPDRAFLEDAARPLGDRVRFTGYLSQDEVAGVLAGADALCLPSFAEGVPVVLMEAMAAGRPVISTRITGIPELVEDGVSGLLVPPSDADALRTAIARLADDPALRHRMGAAGRARVRAEFDVRAEARRLAALFRGDPVPPRPEVQSQPEVTPCAD